MAVKDIYKKIEEIAVDDDSKWLEEARYRHKNRDWLRKSQRIAVRVLRILSERGMHQKGLAEQMDVSPQQISKIVKGRENLTLETISKLENVLKISLFEIPDLKKDDQKHMKPGASNADKVNYAEKPDLSLRELKHRLSDYLQVVMQADEKSANESVKKVIQKILNDIESEEQLLERNTFSFLIKTVRQSYIADFEKKNEDEDLKERITSNNFIHTDINHADIQWKHANKQVWSSPVKNKNNLRLVG